jgi:hypothetical protein
LSLSVCVLCMMTTVSGISHLAFSSFSFLSDDGFLVVMELERVVVFCSGALMHRFVHTGFFECYILYDREIVYAFYVNLPCAYSNRCASA